MQNEEEEQHYRQQQRQPEGDFPSFLPSQPSAPGVAVPAHWSLSSSLDARPAVDGCLLNGKLLVWSDAVGSSASGIPPEPQTGVLGTTGAPKEGSLGELPRGPYCLVSMRAGAALDQYPSFHLQQEQQNQLNRATLLRQLLLAEEAGTAFFSPARLPLLLSLICRSATHLQQPQGPMKAGVFLYGGKSSTDRIPESGACGAAATFAAATPTAEAGSLSSNAPYLLPLLWAVASWRSRLTEPLPVTAAAAAAALGLTSSTIATADVLAAADAASAAAAATTTAEGALYLVSQQSVQPNAAAVPACLPVDVCPRLAAVRALAYWCCCCTLAQQKTLLEVQRRQQRQQQQQHINADSSLGIASLESSSSSSSSSSSTALLRQLQQACRESFALLLLQQQEAQQQLAERQGIEMESAYALREKQEQLVQAAAASRHSSGDTSDGTRDASAAVAAAAAAAAALDACEKDLEELVLQHVSECELLERHWKHEQQLLQHQQLRMFKDVAADLYLLQHGAAAAAAGAACQELVLPPLPSADETDRWAFSWQQQQQQQQQQGQQQQQPAWRHVGAAARQLFWRRTEGPHLEGAPVPGAADAAESPATAAPAAAERFYSSKSAAAAAGKAAASPGTPLGAALGQTSQQQQQEQQQQAANTQTDVTAVESGSGQQKLDFAASRRDRQQPPQQQQQQGQQQLGRPTSDLLPGRRQQRPQRRQQQQRQMSAAAGSLQGPVFDMQRLLQGIAAAKRTQQRRSASLQSQQQQQQQPRQIGGVQEHAQVRLMFGLQQRRAVCMHVCTGLLSDFFPSAPAAALEHQQQQQQPEEVGCLVSAGQWLSLLGRGVSDSTEGPPPGGPSSYCYKDVRDMRGSPVPFFASGGGGLGWAEVPNKEKLGAPPADLFAVLKAGPQASLAGALLPTGAALHESCGCIQAAAEAPDLLLPSLEEQKRLVHAAVSTVRQRQRNYNPTSNKQQRVLLQPGEVFVSRHAAGPAAQVCFHLVVSPAKQTREGSPGRGPAASGDSAHAEMSRSSSSSGLSSSSSSSGDEPAALSAPVCEGLRRVLRLCERHAVRALLLPLLLQETEASSSCLPFAQLQRRVLAVLRSLVTELRAIALSPANSSCCPDASANRLRHLVLLLPPVQSQQQQQPEGAIRMNILVHAAVNFLRNSAGCC